MTLRCAIYTRKSTEDGLEQDFNSLDAQREACEAYIKSQYSQGWRLLAQRYDDGGMSGGTMDRPALLELFSEVRAGRVDIIVVYKVDRLTRSLSDFAKMVDLFDQQGVSFVSVTQQFNTTSSMGRLTLNVLLSFAQFEREVTAERIRDKIAASKKKGMWMGGPEPMGYTLTNKKLIVNEAEAEIVTSIFGAYLELGSVRELKRDLDQKGIVSKRREYKNGRTVGGNPMARGNLYRMLSNPIYNGKVQHKGEVYDGQHDAIIDDNLFVRVQEKLANNRNNRELGTNAKSPCMLVGLIWDDLGFKLTTSHTQKENRRYRYYVSLQDDMECGRSNWRIPALELEGAVISALCRYLDGSEGFVNDVAGLNIDVTSLQRLMSTARSFGRKLPDTDPLVQKAFVQRVVSKVVVIEGALRIEASLKGLLAYWDVSAELASDQCIEIEELMELRKIGKGKKLIIRSQNSNRGNYNHGLIMVISQAYQWWESLRTGEYRSLMEIAEAHNTNTENVSRTIKLAFLSPDIVGAILDGSHPVELHAHTLKRLRELPLRWEDQKALLGFST